MTDLREYNPLSAFNGVGVDTIHYRVDLAPYASLPPEDPIYVGKAEPRGRKGQMV